MQPARRQECTTFGRDDCATKAAARMQINRVAGRFCNHSGGAACTARVSQGDFATEAVIRRGALCIARRLCNRCGGKTMQPMSRCDLAAQAAAITRKTLMSQGGFAIKVVARMRTLCRNVTPEDAQDFAARRFCDQRSGTHNQALCREATLLPMRWRECVASVAR